MLVRRSTWVPLLTGLGCVVVGVSLGRVLSVTPPAPRWPEPEPLRSAAVLPSFAEVVQRVGPGVVTVRVQLAAIAAATPAPAVAHAPAAGVRSGSGFLVEQRGLVVTSLHVVDGARAIEVIVPAHGPFPGELVGEDRATDLALLRLVGAPAGLPALPLGNSRDLRAGDWIVAVGNPFGFAQTVTAGIVSFVGRHLPRSDQGGTHDYLQISAPVNPGSSGCPVVDLRGRVVGVTTQAPVDAQGISFAVPSRTLQWTLDAMQREPDGRVRRGYLGVQFTTRPGIGDDGAPRTGAVIVDVVEGQPAHRAGVRKGDVVLRVDGAPVVDAGTLHERIVCAAPGTAVALQVLRGGIVEDSIVAVLGEAGPRRSDPAN